MQYNLAKLAGLNLKKLRLKLNYTQQALANKLDFEEPITKIEEKIRNSGDRVQPSEG